MNQIQTTFNSLQRLANAFTVVERFPAAYSLVIKRNHETETDELDYEKMGSNKIPDRVTIISTLAEQILRIAGDSGTCLYEVIEDHKLGEKAFHYIDRIYSELLITTQLLTLPFTRYKKDMPIFNALKLLRQCNQISRFSPIQLAILEETSPHAPLDPDNINLIAEYSEYTSTFPEYLKTIKPILQHIQREHVLFVACRDAGLSVESLYSVISPFRKDKLKLFLEKDIYSDKLAEENHDFHKMLNRVIQGWANSQPRQSIEALVCTLQSEIDELKIPLPLDGPKKALLKAYYLLADYWLKKDEAVANKTNNPSIKLKPPKNKKIATLYTFGRFLEASAIDTLFNSLIQKNKALVFAPNFSNLIKMYHVNTENSICQIDKKVKEALESQNPQLIDKHVDAISKTLRMLIVETFDPNLLQKWLHKDLTPSKKFIYRKLYEYQTKNESRFQLSEPNRRIMTMNAIVDDLRPFMPDIETMFSKDAIELSAATRKMAVLSLTIKDVKEKRNNNSLSKQKARPQAITFIEKSDPTAKAYEIDDTVDYPSLEIEDRSIHTSQAIRFLPRTLRWETSGALNIIKTDPNYSHVPEKDYEEMVFRHVLFPEIEIQLDTTFSHFPWYTPTGKCLLYTVPAELNFKGNQTIGFVEYAFAIEKDEDGIERRGACFHRYFAPRKDSLSHRLATKIHLEKENEQIYEEEIGLWNVVGSQTKIEEKEEQITYINEKEDIKMILFR